jgi:hypothetical protein
MERKRVFYYSFEDLYNVTEKALYNIMYLYNVDLYNVTENLRVKYWSEASKSKTKAIPVAGILAVMLLEYYGFTPLVAFTIVNNAPQGAPHIIFHEGNEENAIFQVLMQYYEEDNDYYDAVEDTIEDIEEGIEEDEKDLIGIIIYDGYDTGIAIGIPRMT